MSESGPGQQGGAPAEKREWYNSQTIIRIGGILVGLVTILFAGLALPFGQDFLCKSVGLSCPHVKVSDMQFGVSAIDFDAWCKDKLATIAAMPDQPPGFTNTQMDCALEFSASDPPGFSGQISGVKAVPGVVLVGHLQMKIPAQRTDIPMTVRAQCSRHDAAISMWVRVPCELSPPSYDFGNPYGTPESFVAEEPKPEAPELPEGAFVAVMSANSLDFIARYRLDMDGKINAELPPGDYRVEIAIGGPGEAVEPERVQAEFNVYPPT
ncbi:MAG: hypothetical protein Q8R82_07605 [Hyphomonadaceae bacterium]|nr:hypothetical protein [Hyphomonadaceae bacterium]